MPKLLLVPNLSSFVTLSFLLSPCCSVVQAAELKGVVEAQSAEQSRTIHAVRASKSGNFLQGGVKNDAALHPSLKLLPAKQDRPHPALGGAVQHMVAPLGSEMVRGPGGILYAPDQPVPTIVPQSATQYGSTTPVSSYTLMPQNSRFWVAPGFEMSSTPGIKNSASSPSLYDSAPPASVKGVTSYVSGFDSTVVTKHEVQISVPSTGTGITVLEPGYEVGMSSSISTNIASLTPNRLTSYSSSKGISNFLPGSYTANSAPGSGIICWAPGYEVSIQSADISKETIGGVWSTKTPSLPELKATAYPLQNIKQFVEAVQGPPPMMATALLLPGLKSTVSSTGLNWDQWYHSVAKAVYSRWQTEAVGPGIATLRLNVTKYREVRCQVVGFTSASGTERSAEGEKTFREAALKSVNDVSMFEIPEFPAKPFKEDVTFDIQMKRTVDGPAGIDVSAIH